MKKQYTAIARDVILKYDILVQGIRTSDGLVIENLNHGGER